MKYIILFWLLPYWMSLDTCQPNKVIPEVSDTTIKLPYLVRESNDQTQPAPLLILMHGYGSNEADLFSFSNQIPAHWLVVSVRAPITVDQNKYKWYSVKMLDGKITMNVTDQENSRKQLMIFIDQILQKYSVDKDKIVTAGFSQGANMSVGLLLTEPEKILAAGCFSGRFMEEIKPHIKNKHALKSKQVFIAHGAKDQMLPLSYAETNQQILEDFDIEVKLSIDQVGHTISNRQLNDFVTWLNQL